MAMPSPSAVPTAKLSALCARKPASEARASHRYAAMGTSICPMARIVMMAIPLPRSVNMETDSVEYAPAIVSCVTARPLSAAIVKWTETRARRAMTAMTAPKRVTTAIACRLRCQLSRGGWGHGILRRQQYPGPQGEARDDGIITETYMALSDARCALRIASPAGATNVCGDGNRDMDNEECDDGNNIDTDACTNACENARCGDGIGPGEECDGGDECLNDCTLSARCGNGEVEDGEACDDGNQEDGDGCSRTCQPDAHCNIEGGKPEFAFVTLQPGTFRMGSARFDVSIPVHEVDVPAYQLMREEITVAEYRCCVNAGVCTPPDCVADTISDGWQACNYALGREQHPVNFVTWHNAMDFARWTGHRLPSEAEWEYAARSGVKIRTTLG